jgi:hypothetical protein
VCVCAQGVEVGKAPSQFAKSLKCKVFGGFFSFSQQPHRFISNALKIIFNGKNLAKVFGR